MSATAAPKEGTDKAAAAPEKAKAALTSAEKTVNDAAKKIHDKAHAITGAKEAGSPGAQGPDTENGDIARPSEEYHHAKILEYTKLPDLPTKGDIGNVALVGAAIVAPVSTIVVGTGVKSSMWAWGHAKKIPPFSWVDKAGRNVLERGKRAVKTLWKFPEAIAIAEANVARFVVRKTVEFKSWIVKHTKDWLVHTPGESHHILEQAKEGVTGFGKWLGKTLYNDVAWVVKNAFEHPIASTAAVLAVVGAMNGPGGIVGFATTAADSFLKILKGIGIKFGVV